MEGADNSICEVDSSVDSEGIEASDDLSATDSDGMSSGVELCRGFLVAF